MSLNHLQATPTAIWVFAQKINQDITTNINNLSHTEVPIDGDMITNYPSFVFNNNGIQLAGPEAYIKITSNIHIVSTNNNVNLTIRLHSSVNGLFGPIAAHGHIAGGSGNGESSYAIPGFWKFMAPNEIITVVSLREAKQGSVVLAVPGTSYLLLEGLRYV